MMYSEAQFLQRFGREFTVRDGMLSCSTRLREDLAFDSLGFLHLLFWVESLSGIGISDTDLPDVATLGEVYSHYRALCAAADAGQQWTSSSD